MNSPRSKTTQAARFRRIDRALASGYPYLTADESRRAVGRSRDSTLGFGMTPWRVLLRLFKEAKATRSDVFWDIGSGPGNCVLYASQVLREVHGVEVLRPLAKIGIDAQRALGIKNARFHVKEFQKVPKAAWRRATIVYCYSTCFTLKLFKQLAETLSALPDGARVFTVTRPLEHPDFDLVWYRELPWSAPLPGTRGVFLQLRKPRAAKPVGAQSRRGR